MKKAVEVEPVDDSAVAAMTTSPRAEVEAETQRLRSEVAKDQRGKRYSSGATSCPSCPFRGFQKPNRVLEKLDTYHAESRGFVAGSRNNAQWNLMRALHNQARELSAVESSPAPATLAAR